MVGMAVVGGAVTILVATGTYWAFTRTPAPWPDTTLTLVFVALWLAWIVGSLGFGAFNEALDVSRLLTYPLRREALVITLIGGSIFDIATLLVVPVVGVVLMVWGHGAQKLFVMLALAVLWAHVVLAGQIVAGIFSGLFHNRRFRDLVMAMVAIVGLGGYAAYVAGGSWQQHAIEVLTARAEVIHHVANHVLCWTPPGASARSVILATSGSSGSALAWLAYATVLLVLAGRLWLALLDRLCAGGGSLFRIADAPGERNAGKPARVEPGGALVAMVRKELRLSVRTPVLQVRLLQGIVMSVVLAFITLRKQSMDPSMALMVPMGMMLLLTMIAQQNGFGYEGASMSTWITSPLPRANVFHAWMLSHLVIAVPYVVVLAVVLAYLSGHPVAALGGAVLAIAIDVLLCLVMFFASLVLPFPGPQGRRSIQPKSAHTGAVLIIGLVVPLASPLVSAPAWAPVFLVNWKWGEVAAAATTLWSVVFAVIVYVVVVRALGSSLVGREARIFSVVRHSHAEQ